jgi:D-tyrosyl-tRNA(Tyr) deacylase
MKAVLQRVLCASVLSDGVLTGEISKGLYILLGVENGDTKSDAELLAEKISKLRIFSDDNGKMNLSVNDVDGEALVVSNFTLNANYAHGNRPDYFNSAAPKIANELYEYFVGLLKARVKRVCTGVFGADMKTTMTTDGPVTIIMESAVLLKKH